MKAALDTHHPISLRRFWRFIGVNLMILVVGIQTTLATVRYVNIAAAAGGDGSTWGLAYQNLQDAIDASISGDEIWVAAGTYVPTKDPSGDANPTLVRDKTFYLKDGVKIFGGFAGGESQRSQRNWATNVTTLSGDLGSGNKCYHVVLSVSDGNTTELDGFSITNGSANGSGSITVEALSIGRGLGGGMYNVTSTTKITNCIFSGNVGGNGSGLANRSSASITLTNCIVRDNNSTAYGGGIYNAVNSSGTFMNCTIYGNTAGSIGGAGMYNESGNSPVLRNCIIYGNTYGGNPSAIIDDNSLSNVAYSLIQGGFTGGGNLNADPLFVSSSNLRLQPTSPARNAGTLSGAPTTDLDGNPRSSGCVVDMGAYEYQESEPEINLQGGSPLTDIADGSTLPAIANHTDFGTVDVNSPLARTYTIQNTGSADLVISSITKTGSNQSEFVVSGISLPLTVTAGNSTTFVVTFTPTVSGTRTATVQVNNDDCNEAAYDFAVRGTGVINIAVTGLTGGNTFVFNNEPSTVGYQFSTNQTITVSSLGFYDHGGDGLATAHEVGIFDLCGTLLGSGTVASGTSAGLNNGYRYVSVSPFVLAAGTYRIGAVVYNGGGNDAFLTGASAVSTNASVTYAKGTLKNGLSALRYPSDDASTAGIPDKGCFGPNFIFVAGGTPPNAPEINLQGGNPLTDIADGDTSPATADGTDFGNVLVGGSITNTFTISNATGSADLVINSITKSGTNPSEFTVGGITLPLTVTAGNATTFTVTFVPSTTGTRSATIEVNNNDCDEAPYDVVVGGNGALPGAALNFDGVNDYVVTSTSPVLTGGGFTVELWAKRSGSGTYDIAVGQGSGSVGVGNALHVGFRNTNQFTFAFSYDDLDVNASYSDNNWHHWACVYTGAPAGSNNQFVYRDGVLVGSRTTNGAYGGSGPITIGTVYYALTADAFSGTIDEVRIWNVARSCEEIRQLRNCELTGSEPNLVAYYKFNQGLAPSDNSTITSLTDATTNGNNGTFNHFALNGSTSNFITPGGVTTGTSCSAVVAPEINLQGGSPLTDIADGDTSPATADGTDFGNVLVGGSITNTFTISNATGSADLVISSITKSGTNPSEFTVGGITLPLTVTAGNATTFTVTFVPSTTGTRSATIEVNNNDCDEAAYDFVVTGNGALAGAALDLSNTNDYVSLPGTATLLDGTAKFTIEHWIKSNGTSSIGIVGKGASGCCTNTIHTGLAANGIFFLKVGNQDGGITGTGVVPTGAWVQLTAVYDGTQSNPADRIKIYKNGVLQTTSMFGTIPTTAPSPNVPFVIGGATSDGNFNFSGQIDEVRIWNTALSCEQIKQRYACELVGNENNLAAYYKFNQGLANSDNASSVMSLADSGPNAYTGTFNNMPRTGSTSNFVTPGGVTTGTSCSAVVAPEINLQGGSPLTDIADGDTSPATTDGSDFGTQLICSGTVVRTFTIQNTGTANLTVSSITVTGTHSADFVTGALSPVGPIAPNGSATFTVTFDPSVTGIRTATITVNNNDCEEAAYDFAIQGTGIDPEINVKGNNNNITYGSITPVASNHTDFGVVNSGGSFARTFTIENTVNSTLTISSITSSNAQFVVSNIPASVAGTGNSTATFTVTFTPTGYGLQSSTITVNNNDCDEAAYTFTVQAMTPFTLGFNCANGTLDNYYNGGAGPNVGVVFTTGTAGAGGLSGSTNPVFNVPAGFTTGIAVSSTNLIGFRIRVFDGIDNTGTQLGVQEFMCNHCTGSLSFTGTAKSVRLERFSQPGLYDNLTFGSTTLGTPVVESTVEINVQGGSPLTDIADGDTSPATADHTDFNGTFSRTFTIQNTGTSTLSISSITSSNNRFVISGAPTSVTAGGSVTFTVTYNPTDGNAQTSTITINSDDCDEAVYDFSVTATAIPAKALHLNAGNNVTSPSFSAFGSQPVTIEFWAKNGSSFAFPVGFGNSVLFLFAGGNFSIRKDFVSDYNTGATVSTNGNTWEHFALTWDGVSTMRTYKNGQPTPTPSFSNFAGGAVTGRLQIGEPKGGYPYAGAIDEVRMWNEQRTDAQILASYNTEIASMSPCLQVYWKFNQGFVGANNSSVTTATDAATAVNHDGTLTTFTLTGSTSNWVAGSGITEVTSSYTPAPEIDVQGGATPTSIPDGSSSPTTTNYTAFGNVNIGSSFTRTFTIQNTGNLVLNIGNITFTGTNASDFSVDTAPSATATANGGTTTVTIRFTPTRPGTRSAVMHIANDDCDEADYNVSIQGTGVCVFTATAGTTTPSVCVGTSITLTASAGDSYTWAGPAGSGYSSNSQNPSAFTATSTSFRGIYSVTVSTTVGCTATATASVSVNALPVVSITPANGQVCAGATLNLSATSGLSGYSWNSSGGTFSSTLHQAEFSSNTSTDYSFTVTVSNGTCTNSTTASATVNALPVLSITPAEVQVCAGASLNLSATSGLSGYSWNSSGGTFNSTLQNATFSSNTSTGYSFTVTVSNGTCTNSTTASATVNALPVVNITPANDQVCAGATLNLSATSGLSGYSWNSSGGTFSSTLHQAEFSSNTSTGYSFTVTVSNGTCTNSTTASATVNALPNPTITPTVSQVCAGAPLSLSTTSGLVSYDWASSGGQFSNTLHQATFSSSQNGNFRFSVTVNDGSCTNTATASVQVNSLPSVSITPSQAQLCVGLSLSLSASPGLGNYNWASSGGTFSSTLHQATFSSTTASNFGFTVTAGNGTCSNTATASITVNNTAALSVNTPPAQCGGSINLNNVFISGGTAEYFRNSTFTSAAANPVTTAGVYYVRVTLGLCSNTASASVVIYPSTTATVASSFMGCQGSPLNLSAGGGVSYSWAGPSNFSSTLQNPTRSNATTAMNGTYTVTVTRAGNCPASVLTTWVVVSRSNAVPQITSIRVNGQLPNAQNTVSVCSNEPVKLTVAAINSVSYSWRGPTGSGSGFTSSMASPVDMVVSNAKQGQYTVTASNGCATINHKVVNIQLRNCTTTRLASSEAADESLEIVAAPNPTHDKVSVRISLPEARPLRVLLVDVLGRSVEEWRFEHAHTEYRLEVPLGAYASGVYFLRAEAAEYQGVRKLIRQ